MPINAYLTNIYMEGIDMMIKTAQNQAHSTVIENSNFNKSELLIMITSKSEQSIKIESTTFSGNYEIRSTKNLTLHSKITQCKSAHCPIGLTFKCPESSSQLIIDISGSAFSGWHSGIAFQCKSTEISHFTIGNSSFTRVNNGIDISSSKLTQIAVINTNFKDFSMIAIGTALSSLENLYTNVTKDFSTIGNLTVVGTEFYGSSNKLSICIDLSFWNINHTSIIASHLTNSRGGISSGFVRYLKLNTKPQNRHLDIRNCNFTKSFDAIALYSMSLQSIVLTGCTISGNKFGVSAERSTFETVLIQNTNIKNNTYFGFFFYKVTLGTVEVISSFINQNSAQGILMFETTVESMYLLNNTLSKNGNGMIYEAVANTKISTVININDTTISENTKGGIILSDLSNDQENTQTDVSFQNCLFASNGRNAIAVQSLGTTFTVKDCTFRENKETAVVAYLTNVELQGNVQFIHNTGVRGGALSLIYSQVKFSDNSSVLFKENSASEYGGAIYVASLKYLGLITFREFFIDAEDEGYKVTRKFPCFYLFDSPNLSEVNTTVTLANNSAALGGNNIYGASLFAVCNVHSLSQNSSGQEFDIKSVKRIFNFQKNSTALSISSDPTRVCFCSKNSTECNSNKLVHNEVRYPGEEFAIPLILVGFEFGTVTGIVHAAVINDSLHALNENLQAHTAHRDKCNWLKYSINSQPNTQQVIRLTTQVSPADESDLAEIETNNKSIQNKHCIRSQQCTARLTAPIYINVTLEECPLGFKLNHASLTCECDETLSRLSESLNISCEIHDHIGHINRQGTTWVGVENTVDTSQTLYLWNKFCPQAYCRYDTAAIDPTNPDKQCQLYRSGILCGSCKTNYSLLLGSNRCSKCADNAGISLVLFFLAAGFLLVMIIKFLDLTVANGTVNGIIFYANVVWGYNRILLPAPNKNDPLHWILTVPIAWINLDFGIETCFFVGLNSFVKAWLQFLFPLYIWSIASSIILISHYSRRATKLFGENSVAVLATLLLLSYGKILRNIMTILDTTHMHYSNSTTTRIVWAIDGNLEYGKYPHGFLLAFGLIALVFVWLPCILILLLVPVLKPKSRHKPLRWINTLKPLFDAYYGPYNDRLIYQCWIGILLVVRGVLLVVLAAASNPFDSILFLGILSTLLLAIASISTYKKLYLSVSEIIYLLNLAILSGLWSRYNTGTATAATQYPVYTALSISFALLQCVCLVVTHLIQKFLWLRICARKTKQKNEPFTKLESIDSVSTSSSLELEDSSRYRDSILSYISYTD